MGEAVSEVGDIARLRGSGIVLIFSCSQVYGLGGGRPGALATSAMIWVAVGAKD